MSRTLRVQIFPDEDGEPVGIFGPDDEFAPFEEEQGFVDVPADIVHEWRAAADAYDRAIDRLREFVDSIEPEGEATKEDWERRHLVESGLSSDAYRARVAGCEHPILVRWSIDNPREEIVVSDGIGKCATCEKYISPRRVFT